MKTNSLFNKISLSVIVTAFLCLIVCVVKAQDNVPNFSDLILVKVKYDNTNHFNGSVEALNYITNHVGTNNVIADMNNDGIVSMSDKIIAKSELMIDDTIWEYDAKQCFGMGNFECFALNATLEDIDPDLTMPILIGSVAYFGWTDGSPSGAVVYTYLPYSEWYFGNPNL